jgi:enterochelin esterase-like enzyme
MKQLVFVLAMILCSAAFAAPDLNSVYKLGPDSLKQPNVPEGKMAGPLTLPSQAYPGTSHTYWVYTPAQYDSKTPACLMVFQDGHAFMGRVDGPDSDYRIPNVFDNLIYRREMPVTIAVFINPGRTADQKEASPSDWGDRSNNRPQEYNALDNKYAKVVCDELLPELKKTYNISDKAGDHAIAGASSGAIAAFTVAWHRPEVFHKVISTIGSFTNIRGGHKFPDMIREADAKPIRIFLQDGVNDNRGIRGRGESARYDATWDWHAQNIKMVEALTEKHYDVNYTWGIGTHSNKQGGAIMPSMLRWLWRDYPRPDDPKDDSNRKLLDVATATQPVK